MTSNSESMDAAKVRPGSYIRDQLANERTFLAWLRTALAMMGFGILIVKLRYLVPQAATQGPLDALRLGLLFAVVGFAMVPFSVWHYLVTRRAIDDEAYVPEGASIVVFGIAIMVIGIGVMIYLLTSSSGAPSAAGAVIGNNPAAERVLIYL